MKEKLIKHKKIIISMIAIILILLIVVIIFLIRKEKNKPLYEEQNGKKVNTSRALAEEREFEGLKIKDIKLEYEGYVSRLTATLKNESEDTIESQNAELVFIDKEGNELERLEFLLPQLTGNAESRVNTAITADIADAYDFKIEKKIQESDAHE